MSKPPVQVLRYGTIKVCIWHNQTTNGSRFSVRISRLFKNGDKWSESSRFGRDDLLVAAKLLDQAHTWIHHSQANEE